MLHIDNTVVRIIMSVIFSAGFIIFIAPFFAGIVNAGNCFGAFICALMSLFSIFNDKVSEAVYRIYGHTAGKIAVISVITFLISGFILAAVISGFMIHSMNDKPSEPDTVIILGCKVKGQRPSLMLKRRLDTACKYLKENNDVLVIVSGGQGKDEIMSEAECMKSYLIQNGISSDRIYKEDRSSSTYENFKFSKEIMQEYNLGERLTVVTDGYHQLRAGMIADSLGIETNAVSAPTALWLVPTYWVREWIAVVYTFIH